MGNLGREISMVDQGDLLALSWDELLVEIRQEVDRAQIEALPRPGEPVRRPGECIVHERVEDCRNR
jgi:hypothetical protein